MLQAACQACPALLLRASDADHAVAHLLSKRTDALPWSSLLQMKLSTLEVWSILMVAVLLTSMLRKVSPPLPIRNPQILTIQASVKSAIPLRTGATTHHTLIDLMSAHKPPPWHGISALNSTTAAPGGTSAHDRRSEDLAHGSQVGRGASSEKCLLET